jgi:toxin YoeB
MTKTKKEKTIAWTDIAWEQYLYWQAIDSNMLARINKLISDIMRNPFSGLGKPEPLKYNLAGKWSRRINDEHRLVYEIKNGHIVVYQCRYHY